MAHFNSSRSQLQGGLFAIASFTCFVVADTCLKALVRYRLPAYEVVSSVACMELVLLVGYAAVRGRLGSLQPKRPARPLLRSGLDLMNSVCVVIALRHLPLALFYILVFLAPAVTTLLEAALLQEPLGRRRWLAVTTGFVGVVVAVDPLGAMRAGDRTGYLACLGCVACFSVNMVWSREISRDESAESLTFVSSLVQAAVGSAVVLGHFVPVTPRMVELFAAAAVVSLTGGMCFFLALRRTSAATVSQYHYTQLVTGAVVAFAIWRERPTVFMCAGAVLIVASGWMAARIVRREPVMPLEM